MIFSVFAIASALATVTAMGLLIRHRRLKEKYSVVWLVAAVGTLILGVFPPILDPIADVLHVQQGPNLLFLVADVAMMLICVQLSVDASTQAYRSRTLAEEVAILRLELERQAAVIDGGAKRGPTGQQLPDGQ